MDFLWTPWRYQYVAEAKAGKQPECIFCDALARTDDDVTLIVHRGTSCFVILNLYPYTSGHAMIVLNAHVAKLSLCDAATLSETMQLAQKIESILQILYKPDGMNYGINLGRAAGAGVTGHLHMHALPRWIGDANFMTVTAETRLHAETIPTTYKRFREAFAALGTK